MLWIGYLNARLRGGSTLTRRSGRARFTVARRGALKAGLGGLDERPCTLKGDKCGKSGDSTNTTLVISLDHFDKEASTIPLQLQILLRSETPIMEKFNF